MHVETKEKIAIEEKSYINTRLNELKDKNNNRLKFGGNPLKIINEIYDKAKVTFKNKVNNKSIENAEKTNRSIYKSVLEILHYADKIKLLPKIIFDFKNFDKNTFSVKDRSSNNFNNNGFLNTMNINNNILNSFQAKCYSKNFDFQPNSNLTLKSNYTNNFQPKAQIKITNKNPNASSYNYSYDSDDMYIPENNNNNKNNINANMNIKNINIPQETLAQNNATNLMDRAYVCDICNEVFSNGQGLGGHMSRKHPNQSVKYKFKKETREKRNLKREIIYEAKRKILKKYHESYDDLMNSIEGRKIIKRICKDNKDEYYRIKKEIKSHMK